MRPLLKIPARPIGLFENADTLRHLLIEAVGPYCAYCESPITMDLPWAPRISTSNLTSHFQLGGRDITFGEGIQSRRFGRAWVNQQLICTACAAAKANLPGSRAGFERLLTTNPARFNALTAAAPERIRLDDDGLDDLYIAAFFSCVWPDVSSDENGVIVLPGDNTFRLFTYDQSAKSQVQLEQQQLVRLSPIDRGSPWASQPRNQVWVVPDEAYIQTQDHAADLLSRTRNTLLLLNLNYSNPSDPTAADRRVENRTTTLTIIEQAIGHLKEVVRRTAADNRGGDEDLEHQRVAAFAAVMRELLRATGFWSLWTRRLMTAVNDDTDAVWRTYSTSARRRLLYTLLVEYEFDLRQITQPLPAKDAPVPDTPFEFDEDIISQMVLPGTDLDRLPF